MRNYIIRRVLIAIPVVLAITFINFSLMHLAPGNPLLFILTSQGTASMPATQAMGELSGMNGDYLKQREHELGLDKPLVIQYVNWLGQIGRGDLGRSMENGELVEPELLLRVGVTLQLTIPSLIISVTLGIILGTLAAVYQNSWFDQIVSFFTYILLAIPGFLLGLGAIAIIALRLHWLPVGTMYDPATNGALGDRLFHLIMPLTIIGLSGSVGIIRFTRTSVLEVMGQEYVTVARSKGIQESAILVRHIVRNALVPVLTIVGYYLPGLFGGSALFETVFQFPGLGQWVAYAASAKDYPVLMAVVTITAILIVLSNLAIDIAYAVVDPRISYS